MNGQQPTTTATRYYPTPGGALLVRDASGLSSLATDQLGTPIATVNLDTGAVLGEQLRAPYGEARYAVAAGAPSGGMHTSVGFTGQREDTSGLAYFNAREYDPAVGRFTSADTLVGADAALDGYAYVGGMVESASDPSGHWSWLQWPKFANPAEAWDWAQKLITFLTPDGATKWQKQAQQDAAAMQAANKRIE